MRSPSFPLVLAAAVWYLSGAVQATIAEGTLVFAHYMVGTVTQAHAAQDINDAKNIGLNGFALNIGDATQAYVMPTLQYLFAEAERVGNFKLYISMDVYASGASCYAGGKSCNGPHDYDSIIKWAIESSAYQLGPNYLPMVSTFSSGGFHNDTWKNWWLSVPDVYFIPNFDETEGYYGTPTQRDDWYYYWGHVVNGVMSWESAWPKRSSPGMRGKLGGDYPGDVGWDQVAQAGALKYGKEYMMGLSPMQYKNSYGANIYRMGGLTLPIRIQEILGMRPAPDYVVVISWNDGPESHYIGNVWPEQNTDAQPALYVNEDWSHIAWQPLIRAFIGSMITGFSISTPDVNPVGASWYHTVLTTADCAAGDAITQIKARQDEPSPPPNARAFGSDSATDYLHYYVIVPVGMDWYLRGISNGVVIDPIQFTDGRGKAKRDVTGRRLKKRLAPPQTANLYVGLNYGSFKTIIPGWQRLEILDANSNVLWVSQGGLCVSVGCPDNIYNLNYQVVPFTPEIGGRADCHPGSSKNPSEEEIKDALKSEASINYFWSGLVLPERDERDSVRSLAEEIARERGGQTLELRLFNSAVKMPTWGPPEAKEAWRIASRAFADQTSGEAWVIKGSSLRLNNTWEKTEFPALKENNKMTCIWELPAYDWCNPLLLWFNPVFGAYDCYQSRERYLSKVACVAWEQEGWVSKEPNVADVAVTVHHNDDLFGFSYVDTTTYDFAIEPAKDTSGIPPGKTYRDRWMEDAHATGRYFRAFFELGSTAPTHLQLMGSAGGSLKTYADFCGFPYSSVNKRMELPPADYGRPDDADI